MSEPQERGPNYDWKHEASYYRDECENLRELLRKVEASGERDLAALKAERDRLAEEVERLHDKYDLQLLVRRSDRYREALEWYADKANYRAETQELDPLRPGRGVVFGKTPVNEDGGSRARTALEDKR